jgi:cellulose biosynthesis protein BcsQ
MIVTFYSFKGGVGRTLALANVGVVLAQNGHRVLVVDFDLEAPGLTRYLEKEFGGDLQYKRGLLELLEQQRNTGNAADHLREYAVEIARNVEGGILELLTSGYQDKSYPKRVLDFDWSEFFMNDDGGNFFERCRQEWAKLYDYVLIDSRTGITDSGGVCTIQLPDIIVPVFTASRQSVDGVIDVMRRAQEGRQLLAYDRAPAAIVPLPSRFDSRTEYELSQQWLDEFAIQFKEFYKSWLPKEIPVRQVLERTKLPYVAFFSFGERLPVFEESGSDPESLGYALRTFTRLLENRLQDASSLVAFPGGGADHGETVTLTGIGDRATGVIRDLVATTAEAVFQRFDLAGQQAARRLLLRMIQVGDGAADSCLRVDRHTLIAQSPDPALASAVFDAFARAGLITVDENTAEITDEALLRAWPRLRSWIESDRTGLYVHQQLTEAAQRWDRDGRPDSVLYRDTALAVAQEWAQKPDHHSDLGKLERDFLDASQALRGRQQQASHRRTHRLRQLIVGLVVLLILSLAGGGIALYQSRSTPPQSSSNPITVLVGHTDAVDAVRFSPDGRTLASGSADRTVWLWNMTNPIQPIPLGEPLTGHTGTVFSVAFSPDGRTLASGSADQTIRLWDMTDPTRPLVQPLAGHTGTVFSVAFSPDGRTLASGSADQTIRLWDVTDRTLPKPLGQLAGHTGTVFSVAFSPDGHTLASGSADQTIRLWDITGPTQPVVLVGHGNTVTSVAFSPDGHTLASGSADQTVRLWNADPAHPKLLDSPLTGHTNFVTSVAFSPDGHTLASGSADQTVRLRSLPLSR